ncbi:Protein kinase domain [Fusarium oxysporum f. sp. vasinfectum]|nr:Protein kinase domain [Fusarium oxysporum f. sp. vasinfectum]
MNELPSNPLKSVLKPSLLREKDSRRRFFLPAEAINSICNQVTVHEELLRYYFEPDAIKLAGYVCSTEKPAREVFSILVLVDKVNCIHRFCDAGMLDDDLPLGSNNQNTELWSRHSTVNEPLLSGNSPEDSDMIGIFYEKQWSVHVPVFDFGSSENQRPVHYQFDEGTIIPWVSLGKKIETGGYGIVEKLKIHLGHYHSIRHNTFALKILRSDIEDPRKYFWQEITAFRKLRRGPHLVELVATIEIAECQFMFIFPWAEGGALEDLITQKHLNRIGENLLSHEFICWVLDQCRGLVEALETIHFTRTDSIYQSDGDLDKDYGLHLDIKPSNILYFSQETETSPFGILKLADCGLMEFHSLASRSRKSVTGCSVGPRTYRLPEYDFNHTISKKVDVWAMGCVFTEFLTWAILPHGSVDEYRLARTQEPSVTSARQETRNNYENSFFQHFLQYEVTDGAVVSVPELATQTDHISLHVRAWQTNSNTWRLDSDEFRIAEFPKLKSSVSQWIAKLIPQ